MKAIHGFDQRKMLIRFVLTGSEGDIDIRTADAPMLRGKPAATLWYLLKAGQIARIDGLDTVEKDPRVIANIQRLYEGDEVLSEWEGTEKQVMTRLYIVCDTKQELAETLRHCMDTVHVYGQDGSEMLLKGFDVKVALGF